MCIRDRTQGYYSWYKGYEYETGNVRKHQSMQHISKSVGGKNLTDQSVSSSSLQSSRMHPLVLAACTHTGKTVVDDRGQIYRVYQPTRAVALSSAETNGGTDATKGVDLTGLLGGT